MTDGVYGIGYGNTSGVGGSYYAPRQNNNTEETAEKQTPANNYNDTQVDPNKVMDFLANNNYFMPVNVETKPAIADIGDIDAETEERIAGYMERFEEIYSVVESEFGAELAPAVMDLVMDKLMGMA